MQLPLAQQKPHCPTPLGPAENHRSTGTQSSSGTESCTKPCRKRRTDIAPIHTVDMKPAGPVQLPVVPEAEPHVPHLHQTHSRQRSPQNNIAEIHIHGKQENKMPHKSSFLQALLVSLLGDRAAMRRAFKRRQGEKVKRAKSECDLTHLRQTDGPCKLLLCPPTNAPLGLLSAPPHRQRPQVLFTNCC